MGVSHLPSMTSNTKRMAIGQRCSSHDVWFPHTTDKTLMLLWIEDQTKHQIAEQ